jgi:AAA family ATPase
LEKLDNILLIGSTNLSNSLDPALLSRFSQQIEFRLPDEKEIISILKYYLPILEDNGIDQIARMLK